MELIRDHELSVIELGDEQVPDGSYNIINNHVREMSNWACDEGHWAYFPFDGFESFSRVIIGRAGENRVTEMNYNLQLGLSTLYIEGHQKLDSIRAEMLQRAILSPNEQQTQENELIKARENLRTCAKAIHTAWGIQGSLHMWRSHWQSLPYRVRFSRILYREVLDAWKVVRDEIGEDDSLSVTWLDSWAKRFTEYYNHQEDGAQQMLSWNMIHDVGDADFGHQPIHRWQVEINKFRYRHRSILDIRETIAGIKERMSQFRLMIMDPQSYHGWSAGNWFWQTKTEEFRTLNSQWMDLEFRKRLQDSPSSLKKFLELDRLALIMFKNQIIDSFSGYGHSSIRADQMIESWHATFCLLLNYDMICTGYAWSHVKSTAEMDTDSFIINYQDIGSRRGGWECSITMEKIDDFLLGLKSFVKRRSESLRRRNKKAATKSTTPKSTLPIAPEQCPIVDNYDAEQSNPRSMLADGKEGLQNIAEPDSDVFGKPVTPSTNIDTAEKEEMEYSDRQLSTSNGNKGSKHEEKKEHMSMSPFHFKKLKRTTLMHKIVENSPVSTSTTEASGFDWFDDVNESMRHPYSPPTPYDKNPKGRKHELNEIEGAIQQEGRESGSADKIGDGYFNSKSVISEKDRLRGLTYAMVTKTGDRMGAVKQFLKTSQSVEKKDNEALPIPVKNNETVMESNVQSQGQITPSSGPWVKVLKKMTKKLTQTNVKNTDTRTPPREGKRKLDLHDFSSPSPSSRPLSASPPVAEAAGAPSSGPVHSIADIPNASPSWKPCPPEIAKFTKNELPSAEAPGTEPNNDTNIAPTKDSCFAKGSQQIITGNLLQDSANPDFDAMPQAKGKAKLFSGQGSTQQSKSSPKRDVGTDVIQSESEKKPSLSITSTKSKTELQFGEKCETVKEIPIDDLCMSEPRLVGASSLEKPIEKSGMGDQTEARDQSVDMQLTSAQPPASSPNPSGDANQGTNDEKPQGTREINIVSSVLCRTTNDLSRSDDPTGGSDTILGKEERTQQTDVVPSGEPLPERADLRETKHIGMDEDELQSHVNVGRNETAYESAMHNDPRSQSEKSGDDETVESDVTQDYPKDGQDIRDLVNRYRGSTKRAPSLEELLAQRYPTGSLSVDNGARAPSPITEVEEAPDASENDHEEYVTYGMLASGTESKVYDMLEAYYEST